MRLAWLTDIHLDHAEPSVVDALSKQVADLNVDAVLATGDLSVASRLGSDLTRLVSRWEVPLYFVAGNHDYWGSSVERVRGALRKLSRVDPRLRWLPSEDPVLLNDATALVGVDGWADARLGDPENSHVRMRDYVTVDELKQHRGAAALDAARRIADADAALLRSLLDAALRLRPHVYVATHVPPFAEAARFRGMITTSRWLPWVTCKAVGDALLEASEAHPDRRVTVLCGHMHHPAHVTIRDNLEVRCGAAEYGTPKVQAVLDIRGAP